MSSEISEYDIVEIIAANPNVPAAEIGDLSTILMVHFSSGIAVAYEAECVLSDGSNKWEGTFLPNQVKLSEKISKRNT